MKLNDYQSEALTFRMDTATPLYSILNLSGEVGELHSHMAKAIRDGAPLELDQNIKKELGDIMWSIAAIAADHGWTLEEIATCNINKLQQRSKKGTLQGSGDNR